MSPTSLARALAAAGSDQCKATNLADMDSRGFEECCAFAGHCHQCQPAVTLTCCRFVFPQLTQDINFELGQYYLQQDNVQLAQQYFTLLDPSVPQVAAFLSACRQVKHVKEFEGKLPLTLLVCCLPDLHRSTRAGVHKISLLFSSKTSTAPA